MKPFSPSSRLPKFHAKRPLRGSGLPTPRRSLSPSTHCLVASAYGRLTVAQLEAARKAIRRSVRKRGRLVGCCHPSLSFTRKPLQTRMGKGKGRVEGRFALAKPGQVLFELGGLDPLRSVRALRAGALRLPLATTFRSFERLFL